MGHGDTDVGSGHCALQLHDVFGAIRTLDKLEPLAMEKSFRLLDTLDVATLFRARIVRAKVAGNLADAGVWGAHTGGGIEAALGSGGKLRTKALGGADRRDP